MNSQALQQGVAFVAVAFSAAVASALVARRLLQESQSQQTGRKLQSSPQKPWRRDPKDSSARTE